MQKKDHPQPDEHGHAEKHPKQDFQVERIAFFSDAVFAIAITLLVIEFRVPLVTKDTTYSELWQQVVELKYKFFALLLSFALIANYWMRHHLLFKYIHNYNRQIIVSNIIGLLPMIFFPFTTSFFSENSNNKEILIIPYRLFILNNIIAGVTAYYFYWTVIKRFKGMSYPMEKNDEQEFQSKLLVMTVSFFLIFIFSFFLSIDYSVIGILPMAFTALKKKYFNKVPKNKR